VDIYEIAGEELNAPVGGSGSTIRPVINAK
jgi:hypothetical protein